MTDPQLEVLPGGTHLIANADGVVVVVAHRADIAASSESPAGRTMTALLGLAREAVAEEKPRTGRIFARLATTWLMNLDNEDQVEFGVITPSADGVALFLHGGVTAVLESSDRAEVLHGRDAGFTVDRVVIPAPDIGVGLFVDEDGPSALPGRGIAGLEAGTVPGSGAVLWFGAPAADRAPAARKSGVAASRSVASDDVDRGVGDSPNPSSSVPVGRPVGLRKSAEVDDGAGPSAESGRDPEFDTDTLVPNVPIPVPVRTRGVVPVVMPDDGGVVVRGFMCSRQHLNDPRVSFCAVCGIRMDQLTCVLTEGIRPPLGLLMLDDGTSFVLDNDIVLGREPEHAAAVGRGARPIRLPDRSGGMSRAHVQIRLVEWEVTAIDQGSANGTYIRMPGHQEWIRAMPNHPTTLVAGCQILLGGRVLTFDSQHSQF
ncbi:FHA domain-containing protein [Nocardia sp. NPDC005998]|uniref:FHA domain-containing protein n=1 Tax=Nocardia sp. NPDC005998 TaxID=3156894 RepID=UPI0033A6CEC3